MAKALDAKMDKLNSQPCRGLSNQSTVLRTRIARTLSKSWVPPCPKQSFLVNTFKSREYYPQNIMHDKRVQKGNTYAAMVIPAGAYPDTFGGAGGTNKDGTSKTQTMKSTFKQSNVSESLFLKNLTVTAKLTAWIWLAWKSKRSARVPEQRHPLSRTRLRSQALLNSDFALQGAVDRQARRKRRRCRHWVLFGSTTCAPVPASYACKGKLQGNPNLRRRLRTFWLRQRSWANA